MDRSGTVFLFGMGQGTANASGMTRKANADDTGIVRQLSIEDWWNQVGSIAGNDQGHTEKPSAHG